MCGACSKTTTGSRKTGLSFEPHLQAVSQGYRTQHQAFLQAAIPEFTALYHQHIALEEATVYPEARRRKASAGQPV